MMDAGGATDQDEETTKYPCSETDWQRRSKIQRKRLDDVQPRNGTTDRGTTNGVVSCNVERRTAR